MVGMNYNPFYLPHHPQAAEKDYPYKETNSHIHQTIRLFAS
ncbi:unknown [Bacteroides sp. CAG:702]|nr:unknown [Bacteroides sp. CAG:702]